MVYDGYVEYEEAEFNRPAIMHSFREIIRKKRLKTAILELNFCEICHELCLCET